MYTATGFLFFAKTGNAKIRINMKINFFIFLPPLLDQLIRLRVISVLLPFHLLSDSDENICAQYGVLKSKNMYGNRVQGIERSTFLLDEHGILKKIWRRVKVDGHVNEVLSVVQGL